MRDKTDQVAVDTAYESVVTNSGAKVRAREYQYLRDFGQVVRGSSVELPDRSTAVFIDPTTAKTTDGQVSPSLQVFDQADLVRSIPCGRGDQRIFFLRDRHGVKTVDKEELSALNNLSQKQREDYYSFNATH